MAELFYREDRDVDFFNVCERVRSEEKTLSVSTIVSKAILKEAKSFYMHPREYSSIIRRQGKRFPKNEIKKALHLEILARYKRLKRENPHLDLPEIAKLIAEQGAPRFYISKRRAEDIYYGMLKKPHSKILT